MEEKNKLPFYIKICTLLLLTWICNFYNELSIYYKCLDKNNDNIILFTRIYRLLAKHKQEKCSNIAWMMEEKQNNGGYEKKFKYNNENVLKGKNKMRNECSLDNAQSYGQSRRSKSSARNRENSYFNKRLLDKIYYKNKVRDATIADFKFLYRDISKKLYMIWALFSFIVLYATSLLLIKYLVSEKILQIDIKFPYSLDLICLLIYGIIAVGAMIYLGRKVLRNVKFTYNKDDINNTAYPSSRKLIFL
ncbi:Plasmodium exported protein, unknown function [Plasmodium malariae]|uniref:Uncharacterized protein n=1 Tax=Plasmodium malariae TaxID=5858 RepID=A0A1D3PB53_PLAMA|nr:Plasmodium exported protein, unknown function [Plasmodium malariae]SCN12417.1 Plasmodium exported protein, unknown function [Plasmodium malariae]